LYENGNMGPVETVPRMVLVEIRSNDGAGEYGKNFCKCHYVSPNTAIKKVNK
jgi:hypothetical protein